MGKYDPLKAYLQASASEEVRLSFAEIETLLGSELPKSRCYAAWWSNNPANNVMTRVWLEAGYRTERVDLAGRKVVFRRARTEAHPKPGSRRVADVIARLQERLGGTVKLLDGVDLTEPAGETWDAETQ